MLLIKWKNGVAYCLAIEEVDGEEWEKLDRETVSLVLG